MVGEADAAGSQPIIIANNPEGKESHIYMHLPKHNVTSNNFNIQCIFPLLMMVDQLVIRKQLYYD